MILSYYIIFTLLFTRYIQRSTDFKIRRSSKTDSKV